MILKFDWWPDSREAGFIYEEWLNEQPYFIGGNTAGGSDVYDVRSWKKPEGGIPEEYWSHRNREQ